VGITALGYGMYYGLQATGMEPGIAGNFVQLFVILGISLGWVGSYLFRVATKVGGRWAWHTFCAITSQATAAVVLGWQAGCRAAVGSGCACPMSSQLPHSTTAPSCPALESSLARDGGLTACPLP
jgi:hypothetical protein